MLTNPCNYLFIVNNGLLMTHESDRPEEPTSNHSPVDQAYQVLSIGKRIRQFGTT